MSEFEDNLWLSVVREHGTSWRAPGERSTSTRGRPALSCLLARPSVWPQSRPRRRYCSARRPARRRSR